MLLLTIEPEKRKLLVSFGLLGKAAIRRLGTFNKVDAMTTAEGTNRLCPLVNPLLLLATKMEANNPYSFFIFMIERKRQYRPVGASATVCYYYYVCVAS